MRRAIAAIVFVLILNPIILESQTLSKKEFLTEIRNFREKNRHLIIKEFFELLSIPNVSADKKNIRKNAEYGGHFSPDGNEFYFTSYSPGQKDIYCTSLIDEEYSEPYGNYIILSRTLPSTQIDLIVWMPKL